MQEGFDGPEGVHPLGGKYFRTLSTYSLQRRNKWIDMKIAIALFGSKVSPRFDLSPEFWVITVENRKVIHQERVSTQRFDIPQRMEQLASSGVKKLICGGIHDYSLEELRNIGIDVFYNVIGEAEIALTLCLKGELQPGSHCEKRRRMASFPEGVGARGHKRASGTGPHNR